MLYVKVSRPPAQGAVPTIARLIKLFERAARRQPRMRRALMGQAALFASAAAVLALIAVAPVPHPGPVSGPSCTTGDICLWGP